MHAAQSFRRGDSNASGGLDITDGVFVLNYLFLGGAQPPCSDAADSDDSGTLDITDGIFVLNYLFLGGPEPPAPGPGECGSDPTADPLECLAYASCADSGPVLSNVTAPASVRIGETLAIRFDHADPDGDIKTLHVARSNALGVSAAALPAGLLDIAGEEGEASLSIAAASLPFGTTSLTLELEDAFGNRSDPASVTVTVIGEADGGAPPAITLLAPLSASWRRPPGPDDRLRPRFSLAWSDPDGDIDRARVRTLEPGGGQTVSESRAAELDIAGPSGALERPFFTFGSTSAFGAYEVELVLFDRNGNASPPARAALELSLSGASSLSISGFNPDSGPAGTAVVVTASGLYPSIERNELHIGLIPLEVLDSTASTLTGVVREGASSGRLVLRTPDGVVASAEPFLVPATVILTPAPVQIVVGGEIAFEAAVISAPAGELSWSIDGIEGGSDALGTVTPAGVYTAPAEVPGAGEVVVTATLVSDPSVEGEAIITVLPPPSTPGSALLLASSGGAVYSEDGRAAAIVPPRGLPGNTQVSVTPLYGADRPPPAVGRRILGAVSLGPPGLELASPAIIVLPLDRALPPGTSLQVFGYDGATQSYTLEVEATVLENGEQAEAEVDRLAIHVVDEAAVPDGGGGGVGPTCTGPAPLGSEPASGREGTKVPVRLTGAAFPEGLSVSIRGGGSEVIPGAVFGSGEEVGLVLHLAPDPTLTAGSERSYIIDLHDGACLVGSASFTVSGLDELVVLAGETRDAPECDDPQRLYSRVSIAGTLRLPPGPEGTLCLHATGPITIDGLLEAPGVPGAPAENTICGGLSPPASDPEDFCGRRPEIPDGRGGYGREEDGDPDPEFFGANGEAGRRAPAGGDPGNNIDLNQLLQDVGSFVLNGTACVGSEGSEVLACKDAVEAGIDVANTVTTFIEGPNGRPGMGGDLDEAGGGGGGAGRFESPPLMGPIGIAVNGGGGGAGGRPGNQIRVVTPSAITINGRVSASGGRGGDGSATGELRLVADFLVFELSAAIADMPAFRGGGGGGGAGGRVRLVSGSGIHFSASPQAQATSFGGDGGFGSGPASAGRDRRPSLSDPVRFGGAIFFAVGDHNVRQTGNFVTTRTLVRASVNAPSSLSIAFPVLHEDGSSHTSPAVYDPSTGLYTANLVLAQGFNTIEGVDPLLDITILVIGEDTDSDGLSDADEADLGTDPMNPDTDGDGLEDGKEVELGLNPLARDTDGDGLGDGPDPSPLLRDGDEDGVWDGVEVLLGTDPLSFTSVPENLPADFLLADSEGRLAIVDPRTGAWGLVGIVNAGGAAFGLAFDAAGTLFVTLGTRLAIADPMAVDASGNVAIAEVGSFGGGREVGSISMNPQDALLYGISGSQRDQLVRIDPVTGAATLVGAAPRPLRSLVFDAFGGLFASADEPGADLLMEVDSSSGNAFEIGPIGVSPVHGTALTRYGKILATHLLPAGESSLLEIEDPFDGRGTVVASVDRPLRAVALVPPPCMPAEISFTAGGNRALGGVTGHVLAADLSGDGAEDIAVRLTAGSIQVMRGNGDGTFGAPASSAVAQGIDSMVAADLDGDGDLDLATGGGANQVYRLHNDGSSAYGAPSGLTAAEGLARVVAGDVDRDGDPDLVAVSNGGGGPGTIGVFSNGGAGNFSGPVNRTAGMSLSETVLADLDGDLDLDLVVADYAHDPATGDGAVLILKNGGTGSFDAPADIPLPRFNASFVAASDLDVDGDPDILVSKLERFFLNDPTPNEYDLDALYNDGSGSFSEPVRQFSHGNLTTFAARDLDGNRFPDVVIGITEKQCCTGRMAVLPNDCAGFVDCDLTEACSFQQPPSFFATGIDTADLDGDGDIDFVVASTAFPDGHVSVFLNGSAP